MEVVQRPNLSHESPKNGSSTCPRPKGWSWGLDLLLTASISLFLDNWLTVIQKLLDGINFFWYTLSIPSLSTKFPLPSLPIQQRNVLSMFQPFKGDHTDGMWAEGSPAAIEFFTKHGGLTGQCYNIYHIDIILCNMYSFFDECIVL